MDMCFYVRMYVSVYVCTCMLYCFKLVRHFHKLSIEKYVLVGFWFTPKLVHKEISVYK